MYDNFRQGVKILSNANHLIQGGLSLNNINNARQLVSDTSSFFKNFGGGGEGSRRGIGGLGGDDDDDGYLHHDTSFAESEERSDEKKMVTMFSGCADSQTSADANIKGKATGAMSWALLKTIRADSTPTYEEVSDLYNYDVNGLELTFDLDPACDAQASEAVELRSGPAALDGCQDGSGQALDDMRSIKRTLAASIASYCGIFFERASSHASQETGAMFNTGQTIRISIAQH